jgi:hypothetical protein
MNLVYEICRETNPQIQRVLYQKYVDDKDDLIGKRQIESHDLSENARREQELVNELKLSKELPTNIFSDFNDLTDLNDLNDLNNLNNDSNKREKKYQFKRSDIYKDRFGVKIPNKYNILSNPYLEIKSDAMISDINFAHDLLGINVEAYVGSTNISSSCIATNIFISELCDRYVREEDERTIKIPLAIFQNSNENMIRNYVLQENVQVVITCRDDSFSRENDEVWLVVDEYHTKNIRPARVTFSRQEIKIICDRKNENDFVLNGKNRLNEKQMKKILSKSNNQITKCDKENGTFKSDQNCSVQNIFEDVIQDISIDCSSEYLFGWEMCSSLKFPPHTKLITFRFVPKFYGDHTKDLTLCNYFGLDSLCPNITEVVIIPGTIVELENEVRTEYTFDVLSMNVLNTKIFVVSLSPELTNWEQIKYSIQKCDFDCTTYHNFIGMKIKFITDIPCDYDKYDVIITYVQYNHYVYYSGTLHNGYDFCER